MAADRSMVIRIAADISELRRNLAEGRNQIEVTTAGMKKLAASLDGNKLIQHAHNIVAAVTQIGGATKLTESEKARLNATLSKAVEKYQAMGRTAPKAMLDLQHATRTVEQPTNTLTARMVGLATAVGSFVGSFASSLVQRGISALVSMGKEAFTTSGKIVDLSGKTGLGTEAIQRMQFVATQTGATLDAMTSAAFKLGVRLSGGSTSVRDAVQAIGLSFEHIRAMKPEQQFETIVAKLGLITNEQDRNRLGVELFGRSFESISGAVAGGYQNIARQAHVSTDAQVQALSRAGDAWDKWWDNTKARARSWLGEIVTANQAINQMTSAQIEMYSQISQAQRKAYRPGAHGDIALSASSSGAGARNYVAELTAAESAVKNLTSAQREQLDAAIKLGAADADYLDTLGLTEESLSIYSARQREAASAAKEHEKELSKLVIVTREQVSLWQSAGAAGQFLTMFRPAFADPNVLGRGLFRGQFQDPFTALPSGRVPGMMGTFNWANTGGPGFLSRIGGGVKGSLKDMWKGMSGGGGISGLFSNIGSGILTGGLTSLMNTGIGLVSKGLSKLFGGLFGAEGKKTNKARDAWISENFGSQEALRKIAKEAGIADAELKKLFGTDKLKEFEAAAAAVAAKLKGFSEEQAADAKRLEEAIKKYGFSFEELGPKLQQQKLHELATELIEDWRVLVGAGLDVGVVNARMADSMNEYLQIARRTGMEVPAALRPILQLMIDQGLLLDENGEAITDLGQLQIKWAESMTQGFDRIVEKLQELLDRLFATADAINNLPKQITIDVDYDIGDPPRPPKDREPDGPDWMSASERLAIPDWLGPDWTGPMPGFAGGTSGKFVDFQGGTPAMLHGREAVVPEGRVGEFAARHFPTAVMESHLESIERLLRDSPRAMKIALQDAMVLAR